MAGSADIDAGPFALRAALSWVAHSVLKAWPPTCSALSHVTSDDVLGIGAAGGRIIWPSAVVVDVAVSDCSSVPCDRVSKYYMACVGQLLTSNVSPLSLSAITGMIPLIVKNTAQVSILKRLKKLRRRTLIRVEEIKHKLCTSIAFSLSEDDDPPSVVLASGNH